MCLKGHDWRNVRLATGGMVADTTNGATSTHVAHQKGYIQSRIGAPSRDSGAITSATRVHVGASQIHLAEWRTTSTSPRVLRPHSSLTGRRKQEGGKRARAESPTSCAVRFATLVGMRHLEVRGPQHEKISTARVLRDIDHMPWCEYLCVVLV